MCMGRFFRIGAILAGLLGAASPLCAQSPLSLSGLSLFSNFDAEAAGLRVFSGVFGGYGVTLATAGGPTLLHGPTATSRVDSRAAGGPFEAGSVSLIGAYTINQLRVAVDIRRDALDFGRRRASTEFGVGFMSAVGSSLSVGAGPTIGFGDVTPSRSPLRPSGGESARTMGLSGTATLSLSDSWALTGVLGYRSRADGAKEESFFSLLGLGYRF